MKTKITYRPGRLFTVFISLTGLFLALLVTANSSSDLALKRFGGLTQKRGSLPAIQLEQVASGLTQTNYRHQCRRW